MQQTILLVEDEPAIREMLEMNLSAAGYEVIQAASAEQARALVFERLPGLVLLDLMLPGMSGLDFARYLKSDPLTVETPIIILTARAGEEDKIKGLDVGADDYITKPFSPGELLARIKAVLRRADPLSGQKSIRHQDIELFPEEHRVSIAGEEVVMGPTEFRLLHFFLSHPKRVYSRSQLIDHVWGGNIYIEERTVDVHIARLRKILGTHQAGNAVKTVRGTGYRLNTDSPK